MDLGFLLGEDNGPRCKGKNRAELFAGEVRAIHDHLALTRPTMWMWGERFLDGDATGIGKWEDSIIGTAPALAMAPKDIVICDWHYDRAPRTTEHFAVPAFQFSPARGARRTGAGPTRCHPARPHPRDRGSRIQDAGRDANHLDRHYPFARVYFNEPGATAGSSAIEAVACFRALFREL